MYKRGIDRKQNNQRNKCDKLSHAGLQEMLKKSQNYKGRR